MNPLLRTRPRTLSLMAAVGAARRRRLLQGGGGHGPGAAAQLFDGCPKAPHRPIATAMGRLQQASTDLFDQAKLAPLQT